LPAFPRAVRGAKSRLGTTLDWVVEQKGPLLGHRLENAGCARLPLALGKSQRLQLQRFDHLPIHLRPSFRPALGQKPPLPRSETRSQSDAAELSRQEGEDDVVIQEGEAPLLGPVVLHNRNCRRLEFERGGAVWREVLSPDDEFPTQPCLL